MRIHAQFADLVEAAGALSVRVNHELRGTGLALIGDVVVAGDGTFTPAQVRAQMALADRAATPQGYDPVCAALRQAQLPASQAPVATPETTWPGIHIAPGDGLTGPHL